MGVLFLVGVPAVHLHVCGDCGTEWRQAQRLMQEEEEWQRMKAELQRQSREREEFLMEEVHVLHFSC